MRQLDILIPIMRARMEMAVKKGCHAVDPDNAVSYTHLRAHETVLDIVCRLLLEKKKKNK